MVDGFATLEQIKQDKRLQHCKVIFYLQKTKKRHRKGLAGANLYVVKPFSVKKN
jgi:CheY-like chemotaxis protein